MSFQHKVDNTKKKQVYSKPAQFRGQVSNVTPELGAASLPLVPN